MSSVPPPEAAKYKYWSAAGNADKTNGVPKFPDAKSAPKSSNLVSVKPETAASSVPVASVAANKSMSGSPPAGVSSD